MEDLSIYKYRGAKPITMESWQTELVCWYTEEELYDYVFMQVSPEHELGFIVLCNDVFNWGFVDCEEITKQNYQKLAMAVDECKNINEIHHDYGTWLFVARERKTRPQNAIYKVIPKNLWPLFDSCGPEREIGMGNPKERPQETA